MDTEFVLPNTLDNAYLLGMFEGDGYTWTGTFGVTNRDQRILDKVTPILSQFGRVRTRSDQRGPYRVCVVGRPLFRSFIQKMNHIKSFLFSDRKMMIAYFAGKFDADGSKWKHVFKFKITYGLNKHIAYDILLLRRYGVESTIRKYRNCNAFDLEISSHNAFAFYEMIKNASLKMSSWNDKVRVVRA